MMSTGVPSIKEESLSRNLTTKDKERQEGRALTLIHLIIPQITQSYLYKKNAFKMISFKSQPFIYLINLYECQ